MKNIKKPLFFLLCLTSALGLVACKNKNNSKPTTTDDTTTTTEQKNTEKEIPAQYKADKQTYDAFFNPTSSADVISLNVTMTMTRETNQSSTPMTAIMKISEGKAIQSMGGKDMMYQTYSVNASGNIVVHEYMNGIFEPGWIENSSSPKTYTDISTFCNENVLPYGFDFTKFTFNYNTNTYETNEVIKYDIQDEYNLYKSEFSNYKVKFENNKPVSISFKRIEKEYNMDGELIETFEMTGTITFSDFGTTVVEPIVILSVL